MTPLVIENGPSVTFLRRKMTGVDFRWGSLFVGTPASTNDQPKVTFVK